MRRTEPDANAGEAARPNRHRDPIERGGPQTGGLHDPVDHRQQGFGVPVAQRLAFDRNHSGAVARRYRAGGTSRIDRQQGGTGAVAQEC